MGRCLVFKNISLRLDNRETKIKTDSRYSERLFFVFDAVGTFQVPDA